MQQRRQGELMSNLKIRGLEAHEELSGKELIRDTRSIWVQSYSVLKSQTAYMTILIILMLIPLMKPGLTYLCLLFGNFMFVIRYIGYRKDRLPFRLPATADTTDYSDPIPGRKKFFGAGGIFHLGNEYKTSQELWLKAKDILTHMLILGTTGSGKTETLVSLAFNALAMGSGFFYIDPKAAPKLAAQIYIMARYCGRDDDFRVMNYSTAGKPAKAEHPKTLSNTNNPFAFGSAEGLTQLLVSLIPKSEGDNAIFGQNAQTLITSAMYALVELRDRGEIELSIESIREHLTLQMFEGLARREDLSEATLGALKSFLTSVGWQENKPSDKQPRSLPEQFGYARSYFSLSLASLTDTYGHIYKTALGEVDMFDVIKNRRILVVMLPSLEKAPQELENLGKISLSAVRNAISIGLGDKLEGTMGDVLESLPTDSPTPFLVITDEYAAIPTPGYAEVLTQGRSLGISAIVASQDYAGIKGADEIGAQQIVANTKIKLAMKLEDPKETWDLFNALAGESNVLQTDGFHIDKEQALPLHYMDRQDTKPTKYGRIHMRDLQTQIEGEFHGFFNGEITRGRCFYANPNLSSSSQVRINQMVPVPIPSAKNIEFRLRKRRELVKQFTKMATQEKRILTNHQKMDQDCEWLKKVFDASAPIINQDVAVVAFMHWLTQANKSKDEFSTELKNRENLDHSKKNRNQLQPTLKNIDIGSMSLPALLIEKSPENKSPERMIHGEFRKKELIPVPDVLLVPKQHRGKLTEYYEDEIKPSQNDVYNAFKQISSGVNKIVEFYEGIDDSAEDLITDMASIGIACGDTEQKALKKYKNRIEQVETVTKIEYPENPVPSDSPESILENQADVMKCANSILSKMQKKDQNAK